MQCLATDHNLVGYFMSKEHLPRIQYYQAMFTQADVDKLKKKPRSRLTEAETNQLKCAFSILSLSLLAVINRLRLHRSYSAHEIIKEFARIVCLLAQPS